MFFPFNKVLQVVIVLFFDFHLILKAIFSKVIKLFFELGFIEKFFDGSHDGRGVRLIFNFGSILESVASVETDWFSELNKKRQIFFCLLSFLNNKEF